MQISPGEDKIPVSTPASVRRHSFALLVIAVSLVGDTCDPLRVLIAGCSMAVNHCAVSYSGNKGDHSIQCTRRHQMQSLFYFILFYLFDLKCAIRILSRIYNLLATLWEHPPEVLLSTWEPSWNSS